MNDDVKAYLELCKAQLAGFPRPAGTPDWYPQEYGVLNGSIFDRPPDGKSEAEDPEVDVLRAKVLHMEAIVDALRDRVFSGDSGGIYDDTELGGLNGTHP